MGRKKVPSAEVYKADEARRSNLDKSEKRDQQNKKELVTKEQAIAAFNQCRLKAEQGDKRAQYHLATMYRNGHGIEQNSQQAVFWYKEAAADSGGKRGNRDAQYQLGIIYLTGWCLTTESPQAGLDLLLQAANQNHAGAQHYLAVIYDPFRVSAYASKIEITKNLEKAVEWLIKAADNGDRAAQFDLGKKYEEGCGVEKSEEKAMEWLAKVAENYPEAQFYLGVKYQEGRGVKKNEAKAFELLNHAANKGHKEALAYLQALTKVIHPHNVYPEVRQLIDATHNVLGENCKVDASKMFYGLWHEGIPPLKDETFYYYTYQFCSSPQDIPKIMKQDTVYLYIEAEKLHYQVVKRGSNDLLDKFHFSKVPPKDGAVMQIYYVHNKTDLAYDCTIADHKGSIYKISIPAQSEDDEQRIQNKIKEKLKEKMVETHEGALYVYSDFVTSAEKESLNKKEKREKRIERKRELSKLKEIVFVNKRLTAEDDIRQISYQCNSKGTKCIYTIVTDDGSLEVDKIAITPQDEPEEIEKKILMDCAHPDKKYGLPKEDHFISLKRKLDEEFGKNGCFEPSYEVRKGMSAPYEEILAYEKNFLRFVSTLIDVLNHGDFKEIFKEDENFEGLRARMVSIAAELKKNQETICKVLAQTAHNSSQMIDNLRDAYSQKNINLENYYEMVGLVQNLHYLYKNNKRDIPINGFFQQNPTLMLGDSTGLNLPALFSAQFGTRRKMLLHSFASYFRKKHAKFYELQLAFWLAEKLASTANHAQAMSSSDISKSDSQNTKAMSNITSNLEKENNKLKNICFNLVKYIWNVLVVDVQQTGAIVIYKTLLGEKARIVSTLSELNTLTYLLLRKDLLKSLSVILTEEELVKLIDAVAKKELLYPACTDEIDQIIGKATRISPWSVDKQGMATVIVKMIEGSDYYSIYKEIIDLTKEIEETCDLNKIISCIVNINKLVSKIAAMNNLNMGDCPDQMRSPRIGGHKVERYLSGESAKGSEETTDGSSEHTFSLGGGQHISEDDLSDSTRSPKRKEREIPDLPQSPWKDDRKFNTISSRMHDLKDERRLAMSGPLSPKRGENTYNNTFAPLSSKKSHPFTISSPLSPKRNEGDNNTTLPLSPKKTERSLALSGILSPKRNDDINNMPSLQNPKSGERSLAMSGALSPKSNERTAEASSSKQSGSKRKPHLSDHCELGPNSSSADGIQRKDHRKSLKLPTRVHSNLSSVTAFFSKGEEKSTEAGANDSQKLML